eukprot:COSAG01_NODE_606_length_14864_cov_190.098327_8_plen_339_part_00
MRIVACNSSYHYLLSLYLKNGRSLLLLVAFHGEGFKFAPVIGKMVAKFVTKSPIDPLVGACFTPHRFFLQEKVLAAFSGVNGTLSRGLAQAVLRTVFGDFLDWAEIQRLARIVQDGNADSAGMISSKISYVEFASSVLPTVQESRHSVAQKRSLGPMQRARQGVRTTIINGAGAGISVLQAKTPDALLALLPDADVSVAKAKRLYGAVVKFACQLLYTGYLLSGVGVLIAVLFRDKTDALPVLGVTPDSAHSITVAIVVAVVLLVILVGGIGLHSIITENRLALQRIGVINVLLSVTVVTVQVIADMSSCDAKVRTTMVLLSFIVLAVTSCTIFTGEL